MKKVCVLTTVHSVFDTRIFYRQALTLAENGYEVSLIGRHDCVKEINKIKIIGLKRGKGIFSRLLFSVKVYRAALKETADIYHFHDPELLPLMARLKKKTRAKVVYDVHEHYPKNMLSKQRIPVFFRKPLSWAMYLLERIYSPGFDLIMAAVSGISGKRFRFNKVVVVRNFPVLKFLRQVNKKKNNRPVVVYCGAISPIRGIKEIVRAVDLLNGKVALKIIGPFSSPSFRKDLDCYFKKEYITYLGALPIDKAYSVLGSADIGVVVFWPEPNHLLSLPNKIFEYMAFGLPVIASDFPYWKEIIKECGLTVNPFDYFELAKKIEYLADNPLAAEKMGETGRRKVLEKYNWQKESAVFLNAYKNL